MLKSPNYELIKDSSAIYTDQAITKVGGAGCYQLIAGIILTLTFSLTGQLIYVLSFLQDKTNITILCLSRQGHTNGCNRDTACDQSLTVSYSFDTHQGRTNFITEAPQLLCYSGGKMSLQGTLYFIGFLFGSLTWMRLTDFWGRKWMIFGGLLFHILVLLIFVIDVNVYTIYIVLFCLGLKASLTVSISYLLLLQVVSPQHRAIFSIFITLFDSLSTLCLPLFFEYAKKWRILYWCNLGLAAFLLLPQLLLVKESPKFLVSMKRFDKAREVYSHIAKLNKRPMFQNSFQGEHLPLVTHQVQKQHGLTELIKNRSLRRSLLIIPILWFSASIVSYGILFSLGNLQGSIYVNGCMAGAAEVLGAIMSGLMANTLGRKTSIVICFLIGGIACLIYGPITSLGLVASYICILVCKFCSSCNFNVVCLITPELFPTVFRGTVFGFGSICARVGGALAPLIDGTCQQYFMYIFGSLSVICGLCSCLLRETKGEVMTDSNEEVQAKNEKLRFDSTVVFRQSLSSDDRTSQNTRQQNY